MSQTMHTMALDCQFSLYSFSKWYNGLGRIFLILTFQLRKMKCRHYLKFQRIHGRERTRDIC